MKTSNQWNRGFKDSYKNQEYINSIRSRFYEFKNKTDKELVELLDQNTNPDEKIYKYNVLDIASKHTPPVWENQDSNIDINHQIFKETFEWAAVVKDIYEEIEEEEEMDEEEEIEDINLSNIPHWTQVVIKSRTDELWGIVIPSKELHLKMNENWEREKTNTLKKIDDWSISITEKTIVNPSINVNIGTSHFIENKKNNK